MINIISKSILSACNTGPRKVVSNLIKGLEEIGYPYVLNKRLDSCKRLWIHDDIVALKKVQDLPPKIKTVVGPNLYVTPRQIPINVDISSVVYLQPSEWAKKFWLHFGYGRSALTVWPAGVDTTLFCQSTETRSEVFIYYKQRSEEDFSSVVNCLLKKKISFQIIKYGGYGEVEYRGALGRAKYIIWLGCHESQGIALEEALSAGIPIIVCDVNSIDQAMEGGKKNFNKAEREYADIGITSAPYFNDECGVKINDLSLLADAVDDMECRWREYSPRSYISQNLNLAKQARALLLVYERYFGLNIDDGYGERCAVRGEWRNNYLLYRLCQILKDWLIRARFFIKN